MRAIPRTIPLSLGASTPVPKLNGFDCDCPLAHQPVELWKANFAEVAIVRSIGLKRDWMDFKTPQYENTDGLNFGFGVQSSSHKSSIYWSGSARQGLFSPRRRRWVKTVRM